MSERTVWKTLADKESATLGKLNERKKAVVSEKRRIENRIKALSYTHLTLPTSDQV